MRRPRQRRRRRRRWAARQGRSTRVSSVLRRLSILSVLPVGIKPAPKASSYRLTRPAQASPTRAGRLRSSRQRQRPHTSHLSPSSRHAHGCSCAAAALGEGAAQSTGVLARSSRLHAFRQDVLRRADGRPIPARRVDAWRAARHDALAHGHESSLHGYESSLHARKCLRGGSRGGGPRGWLVSRWQQAIAW